MAKDFEKLRNNMVERQLVSRGVMSNAVLEALRSVPRHAFVPEHLRDHAYDDSPQPIGLGQTISQPYIVAYMTEQLEPFPGMKVLEIGTGSGYQTAILAYLGCEVYTIESVEELAVQAEKTLVALGSNWVSKIRARRGNGFLGWPEEAPFDAIIVTAAPATLPAMLLEQLKDGGRMVVPVGGAHSIQSLKLIVKKNGKCTETDLMRVRFVPMVP